MNVTLYGEPQLVPFLFLINLFTISQTISNMQITASIVRDVTSGVHVLVTYRVLYIEVNGKQPVFKFATRTSDTVYAI